MKTTVELGDKYMAMIRRMEIGSTIKLTRGEAVMTITRDSKVQVGYRQGGRGGMWYGCTAAELAESMDDGQGEFVQVQQ
jgi:hypothetical protein